jgi:N-acetyl-anhydromuramyl-L-alanine amidase AmpD
MILRLLSRNRLNEGFRPSISGQRFRPRHRADDATERLSRLTEALRQYGYDIPRTTLAGPDEICWID